MSLQFVLGNSGSGKTETVFKRIILEAKANPKKNYLIMAPEQSTIELQRKLVDLSPDQVIMNVDVLGFTRLAYRIFDELGMTALTVLEETGKSLVLRKVAQDKESELTVMRPNLNRMGYITELKSLLSELSQYHITPERLQASIDGGKLSKAFEAKLKDIQTMQRGFAEFMEDKYITQEELLDVFCKVANQSEILKNSVIVFDDYTGFTPVQNQVLRVLLPLVERVEVCMTIDEGEAARPSRGIQDLFDMPKKTIDSLTQMCQELNVEMLPAQILGAGDEKRYKKALDLFWMEQNLFRPTYRKKREKVEQIKLAVTRNPREELVLVAREIHRLVKEEGYRYGDIAVVTGALDQYGNYADSVMSKYQIPFFLDLTTEIIYHPFIEFVRAALQLVEENYSYEAVFRLLRTGFSDFTREEIDRLENYVLAVGVRGNLAWSKRFARMPKNKKNLELEQIEELRDRFYELTCPLYNAFSTSKNHTVREQITALYELIFSLKAEEKLWAKQEELEAAGQLAKAKEYEQIYQIVMGLFDKIVGVLGDQCLSISEFVEIMDAGLSAAKVASLPPGLDHVIIGDIERTRLNHAKVLFFMGVNDGIIPKSGSKGGIISEYERGILASCDMTLAPGPREQVFIQKYYLYLNLTKPSEKLYLSYASVDADGKALRPSYLISVLTNIFPELKEKDCSDIEKKINFATLESAKDYLIHGNRDENWYTLVSYLLSKEESREDTRRLLEASFYQYEDEPISRAVAQALYGTTLKGSVTRMEQFAECAYHHFLQYGLGLREREESGFASVDMGNIYHAALQKYSEKLSKTDYSWQDVPEKVREELSDAAFEEAVAEYPGLTTYATAESTYQVGRMKKILMQTVWALTKQVRNGRLEPKYFEVTFAEEDAKDAVEFALSDRERLQLSGRIDRLDVCEEGQHVYVKVIDYKSGSTKYDIVQIYQGLQLQLVMYLNAAKEIVAAREGKELAGAKKEVIPAGILYYNIDEPVLDEKKIPLSGSFTEADFEEEIMMALRPNGAVHMDPEVYHLMDEELEAGDTSLVIPLALKKDMQPNAYSNVMSSQDFETVGEYVKKIITQSANDIFAGKVSVNPMIEGPQKTSCSYCPFSSVCGFDRRIPGYEMRKLPSIDKKEVIGQMQMDLAKMKAGKEKA